jgi:hypothetical protein
MGLLDLFLLVCRVRRQCVFIYFRQCESIRPWLRLRASLRLYSIELVGAMSCLLCSLLDTCVDFEVVFSWFSR